jgi:diaminopimelate epimerase
MQISFEKYQGTGNDFILLNNLNGSLNELSIATIQFLCDRKFGIGADGLIMVNNHKDYDFEVDYFNADGTRSFCGNGARCAVAFAHALGFTNETVRFIAIDGIHIAKKKKDLVHLKMSDVSHFEQRQNDFILNTGSPHYIRFVTDVQNLDMLTIGKNIRFSDEFSINGINVNLVAMDEKGHLSIRTYERGVEDETLSCGTGVTAAALISSVVKNEFGKIHREIKVLGGDLYVQFNRVSATCFEEIWLIGPAKHVFSGKIHVAL